MKNYIIGIAGKKNSGKDTVASIINYVFTVGITNAKYTEWITHRVSYDNTNAYRIIHFADPLKDIVSILYNIPREFLDNRKYKDELYYCVNSNSFVEKERINGNIVTISDLEQFCYSVCFNNCSDKLYYIKLRELIQYIGTNIFRKHFSNDIWIKSVMPKIINIAERRRLCIVPDIRFYNESKAIKFNNVDLYGGVIKINRKNIKNVDTHSSEDINVDYDYIIENDGTLMQLFYKVLNMCTNIIR